MHPRASYQLVDAAAVAATTVVVIVEEVRSFRTTSAARMSQIQESMRPQAGAGFQYADASPSRVSSSLNMQTGRE